MAQNPVIAGDALARGLRTEFVGTYQRRYEGLRDRLGSLMTMGVPTTEFQSIFGYFESAPHPRLQPRGQEVNFENFRARNFTVDTRDYSVGVEWHVNDRQDDQLGALPSQARMAGENFALLNERLYFAVLTQTADADLLPAIPNAPDGAALFATSRFGLAAGNILTGGGVASSDAIRADFFDGLEQIRSFTDTTLSGQPLHDPSVIDSGITVVYGITNEEVFREAFVQGRTLDGGAAVTNIILDSGLNVRLVSTSRIADNDWFISLDNVAEKPVFTTSRGPIDEMVRTIENSDKARETQLEGVIWRQRMGTGVGLPVGLLKVDN